ncbi:uncharacterized protein L969DRAFT_87085 [Mixia osmundae IAM 14324]|uniref:Uncharacterized protein n=1 Tax=Mixia osmundae (strain CBS 9802 / IAM 14324 / JCM 22182 / KY 12970) TaxID=764103 RepID=G7E6E9_MIXOS|nr:uncharacterized protein L969DRAFT_87085 [Mixia osmundae IAM 14324]KEI40433.1 hypothetical protein L969DRAFT_87085 [Mixia osmundae IAM 14324]GAA98409.1 hypothetical protein E5Q_05095 [Mixia osmundae IAM 14324]
MRLLSSLAALAQTSGIIAAALAGSSYQQRDRLIKRTPAQTHYGAYNWCSVRLQWHEKSDSLAFQFGLIYDVQLQRYTQVNGEFEHTDVFFGHGEAQFRFVSPIGQEPLYDISFQVRWTPDGNIFSFCDTSARIDGKETLIFFHPSLYEMTCSSVEGQRVPIPKGP